MGMSPQREADFGNVTKTDSQGNFQFISPKGICSVYTEGGAWRSTPEATRIIQVDGQKSPTVVLKLTPVVREPGTPQPRASERKVEVAEIKSSPAAASSRPIEPGRPKREFELIVPDKTAIGEYVVRTVNPRSNYVSEWSLKNGSRFEKEFMPHEVGRTLRLLIDIPGFTPVWTEDFKVEAKMAPIKVKLEPEQFVTVQGVVDRVGKPLAGARVRVRRVFHGKDVQFPYGPEVTTAEDGSFKLSHLRKGEDVVLVADHEEHEDWGRTESSLLQLNGDVSAVALSLGPPDQSIAGVLVDQDGLPIPNATVSYESPPRRETKTDAQGKFKLEGLPRGRVELDLRATDGSHYQQVTVSGIQDARFFLALQSLYDQPDSLLKLALDFPDQTAKVKWTYYLIDDDAKSIPQWGPRETTGPATEPIHLGSYLRKKQARKLSLAVVAAGHAYTGPLPITLEPKIEPLTIKLQAAPSPRLKVKVVDDQNKPVPGAKLGDKLTLTPEISLADFRYVGGHTIYPETNAEGIYEYREYPKGLTVSIYTNAPGFAGKWSETIKLEQDTEITLQLSPAYRTISGVVQDEQGKPIADAVVMVHDFAKPRTTAGRDGSFRIEKVPDGELVLYSAAFGYDNRTMRVTLDEATKPITVKLPRELGIDVPLKMPARLQDPIQPLIPKKPSSP
jgi:uncharacterized GH25 family protein